VNLVDRHPETSRRGDDPLREAHGAADVEIATDEVRNKATQSRRIDPHRIARSDEQVHVPAALVDKRSDLVPVDDVVPVDARMMTDTATDRAGPRAAPQRGDADPPPMSTTLSPVRAWRVNAPYGPSIAMRVPGRRCADCPALIPAALIVTRR